MLRSPSVLTNYCTMKSLAFVLVLLVIGALAEDDQQPDYEDGLYLDALKFVDECGNKELSLCFKERALRYVEKLPNNFDIGAGIKIKQNDVRSARQHTPLVLPDEPRAREDTLDNVLMERLTDYLSSHSFEFKVPSDTIKDMQRSLEEGRKKKNKGGGGGKSIIMLLMVKVATLGAVALKLIGLVAFKALILAKIALTISSIIGLKKLFEQKHHTSTYEVVAHPHYEDHGHYDRSFNQELPYRGHEAAARSTNSN